MASPTSITFSPIAQVDGNVSPVSTITAPGILSGGTLSDPAIISAGAGINFQYTINSVIQTKRLFENSTRPALDIRYSNPQTINGHQHHTSVSVDGNSGVYMSSVKPALESISEGWQTEVLSTLLTCDNILDRCEMSGRKVFTKLTLYLTENLRPSVKNKVVVHFYHTSSTVLAQGSSVLSCGKSSPVWPILIYKILNSLNL